MNLLFALTIASSIALLNAAVTSRHEGRKWSKPLLVADEESSEQPEPATELQAPSQDSINYYVRPTVQEPYEINHPDEAQEQPRKHSKEHDSYSRIQNSASSKDQPVQFSLSTRMNFTNLDDMRKPQAFPIPKYGNLPKKFLGFKNKPHYLKFYADDAIPKLASKGSSQQQFYDSLPQTEYTPHKQPKEIIQRLSKHIIESKTEKKILPRQSSIYDSESEAVVPRLSYAKPISEDSSSEEDEEEQEKVVEVVKPTKTKKAKVVKPKLGALTDGKQRVEFQMHGHDGPQSYKFGYDTGKGSSRQFRFEERDNDGLVRGHYGFFDEDGKMHVIKYRASADDGFRTDE